MTNETPTFSTDITGINIRKSLLSLGLRPSNYDEQGLFEWINKYYISMPSLERISRFVSRFEVKTS